MTQSLYIKHQALEWDAVKGQASTVGVLKNDLRQGIVRNVAFVGPKGVGKTTIARLLAHSSLCLENLPDGSPCTACIACKLYSRGANRDLRIINCELHGGLQHVAAHIEEDLAYAPQTSRRRSTIFDEARGLAYPSQQSLLGLTQSDAPDRPLLIFTLQSADALEPALRDRLRIFDLKPPNLEEAVDYLADLAHKERLEVEADGLKLIASFRRDYRALADGLEEVADVCRGRVITVQDVREQLLRGHSHQILAVLRAAARLDLAAMLQALDEWH